MKSEQPSGSHPTEPAADEDMPVDDENADQTSQRPECYRCVGVDKHFWMPGEDAPPLYADSRGGWCKDCHGLFRVYYKASMTLSLFGRWLATNHIEFVGLLVAYLSLKKDGVNHITKIALEARLAMLRFVFGLLNIPFPLAALQVVSDVPTSSVSRVGFLPMVGDGSTTPVLMALVPRIMPQAPPLEVTTRFVLAHQASTGWPLLPYWSADSNFVSWWNTLGNDVAPEVDASVGAEVTAKSTAGSAPLRGTKSAAECTLGRSLEGLSVTVHVLLAELGKSGSKAKERDFTPVLTKLLKFKQELVESPFACSGSLMKDSDRLIEITSAAKKLVRPYRDYLKGHKIVHLQAAGPFLDIVVKHTKAAGGIVGSTIGSTQLKAAFAEQSGNGHVAALSVLEQDGAFAWDASGDPDSEHSKVIHFCITSLLYQDMKRVVQDGSAASSSTAWVATKGVFSKTVVAVVAFVGKMIVRHPTLVALHSILTALETVCDAALQKVGMTPNSLRAALAKLKDEPEAARIHEGFSGGLGAALLVDAKALFVESELDGQADSDFLQAAQNILSTNLDMTPAGDAWLVPADCDACSTSFGSMLGILSEGVAKLSEVMAQWSTQRLLDEISTVAELCMHIARHIVIWDAGAMLQCVEILSGHRAAWETAFMAEAISEWPPPTLSKEQLVVVSDKHHEQAIVEFSKEVRKFASCPGTVKAAALSEEFKSAVLSLDGEAVRYLGQEQLRAALWAESIVTSELLQLPWCGEAQGVQDMFKAWSQGDANFFAKLMAIQTMRPPCQTYSDPQVITPSTTVVVQGRAHGYLPFEDHSMVVNFVDVWMKGLGISRVIQDFLYANLEHFVCCVVDHVAKSLNFLKPLPGNNIKSECVEGDDMLNILLPDEVIQSLAGLVGKFELDFTTPTELLDHLKVETFKELTIGLAFLC